MISAIAAASYNLPDNQSYRNQYRKVAKKNHYSLTLASEIYKYPQTEAATTLHNFKSYPTDFVGSTVNY
jgi:hypothetical protein